MKTILMAITAMLACLYGNTQFVGIGTTTPYSRLHVNGTSWFQGDNTPLAGAAGNGIAIGYAPGSTGGYIFAFNYSSFFPRHLYLQHTGASVVIGNLSTAPAGKLEVISSGIRGIYSSTTIGEAVYGVTSSGNGITGVSNTNLGMYAISNAVGGGGLLAEGGYIGLQGTNKSSNVDRQAVRGENSGSAGGYAGLFSGGTTAVFGTLVKSSGAFLIDHPVEPETKFLYHSFVESPDMKNIYDGVVTTNGSGMAVVTMPGWFETLNMDFRYQLTCIGQFAQAIVANEISNNSFVIQTNQPNVKVSWQVTGTRNDPWAQDNRIPVEKGKRPDEIGHYIYPQGYGKSSEFLLPVLKPTNLAGKVNPEPVMKGSQKR